ncbi:MAG: YHS domain-containing protein [Desulfobacteraceae bacterium]
MLLRYLLLILLGYLGYKIIRRFSHLFIPPPEAKSRREEVRGEALVQDPVCKTFIPRREALKAVHDGKDYYFCSEGCRKRFLKEPHKFVSERSSE